VLAALARQGFRGFEIIIADARSTDGAPALVQRCKIAQPDLTVRPIHNKCYQLNNH